MTEPERSEVREVAQGRAWHTPFTAIGGVALVIAAAFVLIGGVAFLVWLIL